MSDAEELELRASRRRLERDLKSGRVQAGVLRGDWTFGELAWPFLIVEVSADEASRGRAGLTLKVDVTGYPAAPTACPWDPATNAQLAPEARPTGGRATLAFRTDWEEGRALYLPVDRIALDGHPNWPQVYARDSWNPEEGIYQLLRLVYAILNEEADAAPLAAA
jgi:hypothetical protein